MLPWSSSSLYGRDRTLPDILPCLARFQIFFGNWEIIRINQHVQNPRLGRRINKKTWFSPFSRWKYHHFFPKHLRKLKPHEKPTQMATIRKMEFLNTVGFFGGGAGSPAAWREATSNMSGTSHWRNHHLYKLYGYGLRKGKQFHKK